MKKFLIALLIMLLISGCSFVPITGPVNNGLDIGKVERTSLTSNSPQPPTIGMTKLEIAAGFLAANENAIGDFSIAREYLASFLTFEWLPSAGIQVFETSLSLKEVSESVIQTQGVLSLLVDQQRRPKLPTETNLKSFELNFVKENGEWRITNPPSGIVLSSVAFQRNYAVTNLWFFDESKSQLVPDFLVVAKQSDLAPQLIRALFAGSSTWLKPAIVNMFDPEFLSGLATTQRVADSITVDFDAEILRMTDQQRVLLISQMAQTLKQVDNLTGLRITTGGQLLNIARVKNPLNLTTGSWQGQLIDNEVKLYALSADGVLNKPLENENLDSWLVRFANPSSLAISSNEVQLAGYLPNSSELYLAGRFQEPKLVAQVANLSDLNFDASGTLWFLNRSNRNVYGFDGSNLLTTQFKLTQGNVLNHAMVAPDNVRVALVAQAGARSNLLIGRVKRTSSEIKFVRIQKLISINGEVLDLNWYSPTQVILLVNFPTQQDLVALIIDIATAAQTILRMPAETKSLVANANQSIAVVNGSGEIWLRNQGMWSQVGTAQAITFP